tara:strand:- start:635 stop:1318 length:684 start_codon:yes stop_codon:yes gene_type:complete
MHYKTIEIELPKTGNILLWVSGGLDSAAGLYLIAKHIKENKLKTKIIVATWKRDQNDNPRRYQNKLPKDWNVTHAKKVMAWVEKKLKLTKTQKFKHIIVNTPVRTGPRIPGEEWLKVYNEYEKEYKLKDTFGFVTKNPARSIMIENNMWTKDRPTYRDSAKRHHNSKPFQNYDKKFIFRIFEEEGLMKGLYPLTRSCEGQADVTKDFTKPCKKCWWCKEKKWAFTKY